MNHMSLMFLAYFDIICDLFTEQTHEDNMESICFKQLNILELSDGPSSGKYSRQKLKKKLQPVLCRKADAGYEKL